MTEEEKVQTGEMESKIMDELASQKSTDATSQEISELSKKGNASIMSKGVFFTILLSIPFF